MNAPTNLKIAFPTDKPKCSTCKHYVLNPQDITAGICKVFPPQLVPVMHRNGIDIKPLLPMMKGDDYCGQHAPKVTIQ